MIIQSQISGAFRGWDGKTIFKLVNGQTWQQSEYSYVYHYAYRPNVTIHTTDNGYSMQVEGLSGEIGVKRIK